MPTVPIGTAVSASSNRSARVDVPLGTYDGLDRLIR